MSNAQIATGLLDESVGAMHGLQSRLDAQAFDRAVVMLARADAIWLLGPRRAFPIAAYLDYALRPTDKRVGLTSDSRIGRSPEPSDCHLIVQDGSRYGFRSLACTMALAQCLFTALAYRLGLAEAPGMPSA